MLEGNERSSEIRRSVFIILQMSSLGHSKTIRCPLSVVSGEYFQKEKWFSLVVLLQRLWQADTVGWDACSQRWIIIDLFAFVTTIPGFTH